MEGGGFRVQDVGCRVQGAGCGVQGAGGTEMYLSMPKMSAPTVTDSTASLMRYSGVTLI